MVARGRRFLLLVTDSSFSPGGKKCLLYKFVAIRTAVSCEGASPEACVYILSHCARPSEAVV